VGEGHVGMGIAKAQSCLHLNVSYMPCRAEVILISIDLKVDGIFYL